MSEMLINDSLLIMAWAVIIVVGVFGGLAIWLSNKREERKEEKEDVEEGKLQ